MKAPSKEKMNNVANDFPPGMAAKMLNMLQSVESLEEALKPIISKPYYESFQKMSALEKSKIGMMEAYTINSLFWVLMKTSKEEVEASLRDDYKIEMTRLKDIQGRIAEVEAREARPQVNAAVASRLIRRGIGKDARKRQHNEDAEEKTKKVKSEEKPDNCEPESYKSAWQ